MYQHHYLLSHDIDWFALVDGIPVHVASNGGLLPHDSYKISELTRIQHVVHGLESRYRVGMNVEYLEDYLRETESYPDIDDLTPEEFQLMLPERYEADRNLSRALQAYTWSFSEMAAKGFWSFDRIGDEQRDFAQYHLVAWPSDERNPILPEGLRHILGNYESDWLFNQRRPGDVHFQRFPLFRRIRKIRW